VIRGPVLLFGLGTTGASLGLALRAHDSEAPITGYDLDPEAIRSALASGSITRSLESVSYNVDPSTALVVLALPPGEAPRTLQEFGFAIPRSAIVMDLSRLMLPSIQAVASLPELRGRFVPAHPISRMSSAHAGASADRFAGATVLIGGDLTRGQGSLDAAGAAVDIAALWRALGAVPQELAPTLNDALVALTHDIPLFAAAAVLRTLRRTGSMTGLYAMDEAATIGAMSAPADRLDHRTAAIFRLNAPKILPALELLEREIRGLRQALADPAHKNALERLLAEAYAFRAELA
jgi:prephenate dehydrogenase